MGDGLELERLSSDEPVYMGGVFAMTHGRDMPLTPEELHSHILSLV